MTWGGLSAHGVDKFKGLPIAFGLRTEFKSNKKFSYKIDLNFSYMGYEYYSDKTILNKIGYYEELKNAKTKLTSLRIKGIFAINYYLEQTDKSSNYFTVGIGYKYKRRRRKVNELESEPLKYAFEKSPLGMLISSTALRIAWGKKMEAK